MSLRVLSAALAVGIGLVGTVVGASPASAVAPASPVQVAIAVPITVPESAGALISADALTQYTSPLGTLTRQLDAVVDRPVTLGIDPRIIVSIRILGSAAPDSATAWLDRLSRASNETFALSYADADVTLATQAGSTAVLAPEGFDFAIDPTLFTSSPASTVPSGTPAPTATPTSTPSATAAPITPVVPPLPSSSDLAFWPFTLPNIAWPLDATAIAADLPMITASGYTTTILSSSNLTSPSGTGAVVDVTDSRVIVSDSAASSAFRAAVHSFSTTDWQSSIAVMSAAIAQAGGAQTGETGAVFLTLDRTTLITGNRLTDTISAAQADPGIQLVRMTDVLKAPSTPAAVADQPQPADRVVLMRQLLAAETAEVEFATIASNPAAITSSRRLDLLALTSSEWTNNPTGWPGVVADRLLESADLLHSVQVASTGDFLFLAAAAPLPIAVTNNLDQAVTVYVTVRPDTGILTVGDTRFKLVIEPNSQASAKIPAQAVSNGVVGLTVSLSGSSGVPVGGTTRARINVQAGWETPVVVIIGSLVVAVFGGGLIRNIVRLRRSAAAKSSNE